MRMGLCSLLATQTTFKQLSHHASITDTNSFCHGSRFTIHDAALINGTAIYGEDFDDTFEGLVHVSSVIVPTILAIAERKDVLQTSL